MNKDKLKHSIIFFVNNTRYCYKLKLFKLLYFLDFIHYSKVGKSVTGLEYNAWKNGPVPVYLHEEITKESELFGSIQIQKDFDENDFSLKKVNFIPNLVFDKDYFTNRELDILSSLSKEFLNYRANEMIEATHLENSPWDKVWTQQKRRQAVIPYKYAIKSQEHDGVSSEINESKSVWNTYFDTGDNSST